MRDQYRFLRTKAERCYFARVGLEVPPGGDTVEVVDALPARADTDQGEVNRLTAPAWVAGAMNGIRTTLTHAQETGVLVTGCRVTLNRLLGTAVDTRADVVRCAAGLAAWDALGDPDPGPVAAFDGQRWNLIFPARVPNPVQGMSS
jgi:hypothetical protein